MKVGNQIKISFVYFYGRLYAQTYNADSLIKKSEVHIVTSLSQFEAALEATANEIGFDGMYAELLYHSESTPLKKFTIPEMNSKDFQQVLNRRVNMEWEGSEAPAYSYTLQKDPKSGQECLLYMLPQKIQNSFIGFCKNRKIVPTRLYTVGALSPLLAKKYGANKCAILVFNLGHKTILIGAENHRFLVIREISCSLSLGAEEEERLAKELYRTQLFIKQQFGQIPQKVVFFSEEYEKAFKKINEVISDQLVIGHKSFSWQKWMVKNPIDSSENLLPKEVVEKRKMVRRARWLSAVNLIFLLISSFIYWEMNFLIKRTEQTLQKLLQEKGQLKLEVEENALIEQQLELYKNKDRSMLVNRNTKAPVPVWMAQNFSKWVPESLLVSKLNIDAIDGDWRMLIEGRGPRHAIRSAVYLESLVSNFDNNLINWNMEVSWEKRWMETLSFGESESADGISREFKLEGVIR